MLAIPDWPKNYLFYQSWVKISKAFPHTFLLKPSLMLISFSFIFFDINPNLLSHESYLSIYYILRTSQHFRLSLFLPPSSHSSPVSLLTIQHHIMNTGCWMLILILSFCLTSFSTSIIPSFCSYGFVATAPDSFIHSYPFDHGETQLLKFMIFW